MVSDRLSLLQTWRGLVTSLDLYGQRKQYIAALSWEKIILACLQTTDMCKLNVSEEMSCTILRKWELKQLFINAKSC